MSTTINKIGAILERPLFYTLSYTKNIRAGKLSNKMNRVNNIRTWYHAKAKRSHRKRNV